MNFQFCRKYATIPFVTFSVFLLVAIAQIHCLVTADEGRGKAIRSDVLSRISRDRCSQANHRRVQFVVEQATLTGDVVASRRSLCCIADVRSPVVGVLVRGRPTGLLLKDQKLILTTDGLFERLPDTPWAFRLDSATLMNFTFPQGVSASEPQIDFDLAGYVDAATDTDDLTFQHEPLSESWTWSSSDTGTTVEVRFRTPDDAIWLGDDLQELIVSRKPIPGVDQTHHVSFQRLLIDPPDSLALRPLSGNDVTAAGLSTRDVQTFSTPVLEFPETDTEVAASETLRRLILPDPSLSESAVKRLSDEMSNFSAAAASLKDKSSTRDIKETLLSAATVVRFSIDSFVSDLSLESRAEKRVFPDDPSVLAIRVQASLDPDDLKGLEALQLAFMRVGNLDSDGSATLMRYLDAYAECGLQQYSHVLHQLAHARPPSTTSTLLDAILRSRWRYPCGEQHVAICKFMVNLPYRENNWPQVSLAIESLIRMDQTLLVPERELDRWWQQFVCEADTATRWQSISFVSARPSGRALLLKRLDNQESPLPTVVDDDVRAILQMRVRSARKLDRWDFMSRDEANVIDSKVGPVGEQ